MPAPRGILQSIFRPRGWGDRPPRTAATRPKRPRLLARRNSEKIALDQTVKNSRFYLRPIQVGGRQSATEGYVVIAPIEDAANVLLRRLVLRLPVNKKTGYKRQAQHHIAANPFHVLLRGRNGCVFSDSASCQRLKDSNEFPTCVSRSPHYTSNLCGDHSVSPSPRKCNHVVDKDRGEIMPAPEEFAWSGES